MTDREMVIKGLECCREMDNPPGYRFQSCELCPYHENGCARKLKDDALELLKEPEPVKVIIHDEDEWYGFYAECPECGCEWMMDHEKLKYCPHCRKPVKWDD